MGWRSEGDVYHNTTFVHIKSHVKRAWNFIIIAKILTVLGPVIILQLPMFVHPAIVVEFANGSERAIVSEPAIVSEFAKGSEPTIM